MYKEKFASELSMCEVKEYYDNLRQKCPHTDEQWADFNVLKEKLIVFAYKILDGKTNGDVIRIMFPNADYKVGKQFMHLVNVNSIGELSIPLEWWNAPYTRPSQFGGGDM